MILTDPVQLKDKLERTIAVGKSQGIDISLWQEGLKRLVQAQEVAATMHELMETRGWCTWRCRILDDEVIVVSSDELASGYPDNYPVYTELELTYLLEASDSALRFVYQVKKLAGATVTGVDKSKSKNA